MIQVKGRYLEDLTLKDPSNHGEKRTWRDYQGGQFPHFEPMNLKNHKWTLVYCERDFNNANTLVNSFRGASGRLGIKLGDPHYIEVSPEQGQ